MAPAWPLASGVFLTLAVLVAGVRSSAALSSTVCMLALAFPLAAWAAWRAPLAYWQLTVATAPLAVGAPFLAGARLSLPLEALMLAAAAPLLWRARQALHPGGALAQAWCHPVSLAIGAHLLWLMLATGTSVVPVVSLKHVLARMLYVTFFYVGGLLVLAQAPTLGARLRIWHTTVVLFACGLLPVLGLTLLRHALTGFDRQAAYEAAQPFFDNRLELLALLVMLVPCALAARASARADASTWHGRAARALLLTLLVLAGIATLTLHARSAWLSFAALLLVYPSLSWRLHPRAWLAAVAVVAVAGGLLVADLSSYRSASLAPWPGARVHTALRDMLLARAGLGDASVAERANRWACAARMGASRPLQGFGPNSFERAYAGFQKPWELTEHSTWQGDRGDAHSEFLAAWAEQGLPGVVTLLLVFGSALACGLRLRRRADPGGEVGPPAWVGTVSALTLAVLGFALENVVNGLLEIDKLAPFFWLLLAALVSLESCPPAPPERAATSPESC